MRKQSLFVPPSKGSSVLNPNPHHSLQDHHSVTSSTQGGGGGGGVVPSMSMTPSAATSKNCIMFWKGAVSINPTVVNLEVPPTAISLGWRMGGGWVEMCLIGLNDGRVLISGKLNSKTNCLNTYLFFTFYFSISMYKFLISHLIF